MKDSNLEPMVGVVQASKGILVSVYSQLKTK
jgi:hypothetical protein